MLTKYGLPQVAVFPVITGCIMILLAVFSHGALWIIPFEAVLLVLLIWIFSFFRDPKRVIIYDDSVLLSPCDGTVTEVASVDGLVKVSMFLSIYNVHINRAPCKAAVIKVTYIEGRYRNAKDPESAKLNEANEVVLMMNADPADTMIVRQVSGAIARRIVCRVSPGDNLEQGERYGMIKFGSRTELILQQEAPDGMKREICVQPGDKVKAGITALVRYSWVEPDFSGRNDR